MRDYDVAIAGGGPAGAAAAVTLARAGRRVLLADVGHEGHAAIGEGLPPSARSLLRELGVLDATLADGHRLSHGTVSSWGAPTLQAHDFLFEPNGPGWQLDRTRFDAMLRRAAADAGADVREGARLALTGDAPSPADGSLCLRLHSNSGAGRAEQAGQEVRCRWLIDASGRSAALARQLGATRRRDDRLVAFYMRLRTPGGDDRDGRTLVEAVEDGWWYSVLLPGGERLVTRLGDADLLDRRRLLVGDGLWSTLGETRYLSRLCAEHGYAPSGPARGADASSSRLEPAAGERWLAVGDAALAFDPLSSKGIASALYTGLRAAGAVDAALRGERKNEGEAIRRYAAHLLDIYRVYRQQLGAHYAAETRWPDAPFWRRRATVGESRAAGVSGTDELAGVARGATVELGGLARDATLRWHDRPAPACFTTRLSPSGRLAPAALGERVGPGSPARTAGRLDGVRHRRQRARRLLPASRRVGRAALDRHVAWHVRGPRVGVSVLS